MNKSTQEFIQQHINDDVLQLGLQRTKYPDVDYPLAIRQISGRQKFKKKVPQFYDHPEILFPIQLSVEQASSEITAKYKSELVSGGIFVDLTGGFGVDFFFLSNKFENGIYVERDNQLCELAIHNFKALGINGFEVCHQNAEDYIPIMPEVDLIYLDPHRRNDSGKKTVCISDCEPDVSILIKILLSKSSEIMIKLSPMLDIRQAINDIPQTSEIHVLAVENECKEILLILKKQIQKEEMVVEKNEIIIKTLNFLKNGNRQQFDFQIDEEVVNETSYTSSPLQYLYEPNAAIMKSGAFKSIGARFGLKKFHPNTHLYTDNTLKADFPGRIFSVHHIAGNTKEDFKSLKLGFPKANISVRNYPLSVEEYKKKSGIKDGGDDYIFAFKVNDGNLINIVAKKTNLTSLNEF